MSGKFYTLFITSNRKGRVFSYLFSSAWLKALIALGVIITLVFMAVLVDYLGLLFTASENEKLRVQNEHLSRQMRVIQKKMVTFEKSVENLRALTTKIKLIMDVKQDEDEHLLKLALGDSRNQGKSSNGAFQDLYTPVQNRLPASTVLEKEDAFFSSALLDEKRGEVAFHKRSDLTALSIRIDRSIKGAKLMEQDMMQIQSLLKERENIIGSTPRIRPVRGWYSSYFGYRIHPFTGSPAMHNGVDIAAMPGASIYAPADGVVSHVGYDSGYGKLVTIDHGYGITTRFGHNSQVFVRLGQSLKRGAIVASVGSTGRSTSPHLHYEVRVHGIPVDPMHYILDDHLTSFLE